MGNYNQNNMFCIKDKSLKDNTVIIDPSSTICGACGNYGSCHEKSHITRLPGYTSKPVDTVGCGAEWKYVASNYMGLNLKERYAKQFPHLEWNGMYEQEWIVNEDG